MEIACFMHLSTSSIHRYALYTIIKYLVEIGSHFMYHVRQTNGPNLNTVQSIRTIFLIFDFRIYLILSSGLSRSSEMTLSKATSIPWNGRCKVAVKILIEENAWSVNLIVFL